MRRVQCNASNNGKASQEASLRLNALKQKKKNIHSGMVTVKPLLIHSELPESIKWSVIKHEIPRRTAATNARARTPSVAAARRNSA